MQPNKHVYMSCEASFDEATTVIYGAPFDGTVSNRPGTRFAADAIRSESYGLETYSPYLNKDLKDVRIMDSGDVDITIGNKVKVLEELEDTARTILNAGKLPFMIGGEHLVTLGPMRAVLEKYPDAMLVQLDAHTDLGDDIWGNHYLTQQSYAVYMTLLVITESINTVFVQVRKKSLTGATHIRYLRNSQSIH